MSERKRRLILLGLIASAIILFLVCDLLSQLGGPGRLLALSGVHG